MSQEVEISLMLKGAIFFFAFAILFFGYTTKMIHPPLSPSPPPMEVPPEPTVSDTSSTGREIEKIDRSEIPPDADQNRKIEETKESEEEPTQDLEEEVTHLAPPPTVSRPEPVEESLLLPDLTITNLFLNPKKRLAVTIANIGNSPLPIGYGNLKIFLDGSLKGSYALSSLFDQPFLQPNENIILTTPFTLRGKHEVQAYIETSHELRESNDENNHLERILEGLPTGPDIVIKDLDLTEDLDLCFILSNAGEVDLQRGATFQVRVFINGLKISEFDHFIPEELKANFGNCYTINPPYRIGISGTARVAISILPNLPSDDIYLENDVLERTFIIFPFKMIPQGEKAFSFYISFFRLEANGQSEKIKAEARWEGEGSSLMLTFKGPDPIHFIQPISGRSPLKAEFPIHFEKAKSEGLWTVSVVNFMEKKVEGYLIIQHP